MAWITTIATGVPDKHALTPVHNQGNSNAGSYAPRLAGIPLKMLGLTRLEHPTRRFFPVVLPVAVS
jgi:hypothetical protein